MAWEDEDPEEQTGPLAVAAAFRGDDQADAPEKVPPVAGADGSNLSAAAPSQEGDETSMYMGRANQEQIDSVNQSEDVAPELPGPEGGSFYSNDAPQASAPAEPIQSASANAEPRNEDDAFGHSMLQAPPPANLKPYGDWSADRAALANLKAPDPAKYKPSIARRIGAGLASAAMGFGHIPGAAQIGEEALHAPYLRAQQSYEAQRAPLQQKIKNDQAEDQQTRMQNEQEIQAANQRDRQFHNQGYVNDQNARAENYRAQAAARQNAIVQFTPKDPMNPYAGGTGVTASGKTVQDVPPPDAWINRWTKSPQGQQAMQNMTLQQRQAAAQQIGLKPGSEDYREFMANGKIARAPRTSIHMPSADSEKYNDWKTAFQRENNRPPNAAETAAFGHTQTGLMSKSLGDKIDAKKNADFTSAQQNFAASRAKDPQTAAAEYEDELQRAQDFYEQRIEAATGQPTPHVTVKVGPDGNVQWVGAQQQGAPAAAGAAPVQQAAPPPARAAQPPQQSQPQSFQYKGQTYTKGQTINVDGKPKTVTGFNPKTGKLMVE